MCVGEAPPFRVDAKLVLSTASTKTHRYRRVAKETAMISAHRDSNCTVRPGRHSCTLGSAMQRQLQHCGRSVHAECRDSVQRPGLVVLASAFALLLCTFSDSQSIPCGENGRRESKRVRFKQQSKQRKPRRGTAIDDNEDLDLDVPFNFATVATVERDLLKSRLRRLLERVRETTFGSMCHRNRGGELGCGPKFPDLRPASNRVAD
jgi:hypothetical protein